MDKAARNAGAQFIALAGYMRVLTSAMVARWEGRMLNIHPSLLPRHKGLDTHARAIAAGDTEAGCTVHVVTEELDAGPVLAQIAAQSARARTFALAAVMFLMALSLAGWNALVSLALAGLAVITASGLGSLWFARSALR